MSSPKKKKGRSPNKISSHLPSHLPLVLTLNCLQDCELERDVLREVARVESINGFTKKDVGKLKQAAVVVVQSLSDLSSTAQQHLCHAELVVCIGSGNPQVEAAIAEELRIQRLVHVNVQLVDEAADTTLALMLALLRQTNTLAQSCHQGVWASNLGLLRGARRCNGLTLGLLGLDNVALAVAQRALGFGFNMIFFDPLKDRDTEEATEWAAAADGAGLEPVGSVNELMAVSDVVSLHCAPCEETVGIVSRDALAHLKAGAVLVNTSPGELMDEDAVRAALLDGSLAGAALDAVDGLAWFEAWVRDLPNLMVTPRIACYSDQAFTEQRTRGATVIHRFLKEGAIKTQAPPPPPPPPPLEPASPVASSSALPAEVLSGAGMGAASGNGGAAAGAGVAASASSASPSSPPVEMPSLFAMSPPVAPPEMPHLTKGLFAGLDEPSGGSTDGMSDTSSNTAGDLSDYPRRDPATSAPLAAGAVEEPKDLVEGMVVALRSAGGVRTKPKAGGEPSTSDPAATAEALYYGVKQDASKKAWVLEPTPGLGKGDPSAHLMVIRRKEHIGFRTGVAEGRVLQLTKRNELVFANRNFGSHEQWQARKEGARVMLDNRKWKGAEWPVHIEVVGELVDGVVKLLTK